MICSFCQSELDDDGNCPRCGATYPRPRGVPFAFKVRTLLVSGFMLLFSTLLLTECILPELPGGRDSRYNPTSKQAMDSPVPNTKSMDVQRLLAAWAAGQQEIDAGKPKLTRR
jgi:hypothetical protein